VKFRAGRRRGAAYGGHDDSRASMKEKTAFEYTAPALEWVCDDAREGVQ
jgi:hypothetical protein